MGQREKEGRVNQPLLDLLDERVNERGKKTDEEYHRDVKNKLKTGSEKTK